MRHVCQVFFRKFREQEDVVDASLLEIRKVYGESRSASCPIEPQQLCQHYCFGFQDAARQPILLTVHRSRGLCVRRHELHRLRRQPLRQELHQALCQPLRQALVLGLGLGLLGLRLALGFLDQPLRQGPRSQRGTRQKSVHA